MGRGKDWKPDEMVVLAKAWIAVSNDPIVGIGQKGAVFWGKVKAKFDELSPAEHEAGLFKDRTLSSTKSFWNDQLHPEANKFQDRLTRVLAAKLTGNLTEQQKINIAVALHVGQIDKPSYDYRDFNSSANWKPFNAWNDIMRHQPKWSSKTLFEQANKVAAAAAAAAAAPTTAVDAAEALVQASIAAAAAAPAAGGENLSEALDPAPDAAAAAAATGGVPRASLAPIPSSITTAVGVDSQDSGSSGSVSDDVLVASVAPIDPCSASSRKRGGYLGRDRAKNGAKKEKLDDKKKAFMEKKEAVMDNWISQVKKQTETSEKHVATGAKLSEVMEKSHQLAEKKEKKSDIKFMLKLAQKKGDNALFDKYMRKMTQMCSLSDSESEEEND